MLQYPSLLAELDRVGYFPQIVADALDIALADEQPQAFYVHSDVAFGVGTIGRHLTVLVLTATRLVSAHVDDHAADELAPAAVAASTESVPLSRIESVTLTQITARPSEHAKGDTPAVARLAVKWGANLTIDLEPATCADSECVQDHGYAGTLTSEDVGLQVASEVSGPELTASLIDFARRLHAATGQAA
ncbi:MAG: DUF5998 family protein [Bifidobacteriaceae bacterium]|jgi:hypothetical protein|nr:DUF5998 family protein [Bifidobacteriaceae bacterium]